LGHDDDEDGDAVHGVRPSGRARTWSACLGERDAIEFARPLNAGENRGRYQVERRLLVDGRMV
jgi:hypothetical protein